MIRAQILSYGEREGNIIQEAADETRKKAVPSIALIDWLPFDGIEDARMLSDPWPLAKPSVHQFYKLRPYVRSYGLYVFF